MEKIDTQKLNDRYINFGNLIEDLSKQGVRYIFPKFYADIFKINQALLGEYLEDEEKFQQIKELQIFSLNKIIENIKKVTKEELQEIIDKVNKAADEGKFDFLKKDNSYIT